MPRYLKVAAAQMGPNQEGTPPRGDRRADAGAPEAAARDGVELIVYPEKALTTYFPAHPPGLRPVLRDRGAAQALEPLLSPRHREARGRCT